MRRARPGSHNEAMTTPPVPSSNSQPSPDAASTLRRMWQTRPPRIPKEQGGKAVIGGVCEGIGARYQVDPVLVRVLFVVLAFAFGGGTFAYLLCWMCMPRFGLTVSPGKAIATPKEQLTDVEQHERTTGWWLVLGLFIFFSSVSLAGDLRAVLAAALVLAAAWFLADKRMPVPPAGLNAHTPSPGQHPARGAGSTAIDTSQLTPPEGYPHPAEVQSGRVTPPSWDPLGTAPGLWHLPEPTHPVVDQPRRKRRAVWLWVPLAVLVTAVTLLTVAMADSARYYNFNSGDVSGWGNADLTFTEVSQVPDMHRAAGKVTLDLSGVEPIDSPTTIEVGNYVGAIDIIAPREVPVEAHCAAGLGLAHCPDNILNEDAEGEMLTIDARQFIGVVTVRTQ